MARERFQCGRWGFATKTAAETALRSILARHGHMQRLSGDDEELVLALIDLDPRRDTILGGSGVRAIAVQHIHDALGRPARRFLILRPDRSLRDFSWRNALYPRSAKSQLASVLRSLVITQIQDHKQRHFTGQCELCGAPLSASDCHVDHARPITFDSLMAAWLLANRLEAEDIALVPSPRYETATILEDPLLASDWMDYHEHNAQLRCVCRDCNLSALRLAV